MRACQKPRLSHLWFAKSQFLSLRITLIEPTPRGTLSSGAIYLLLAMCPSIYISEMYRSDYFFPYISAPKGLFFFLIFFLIPFITKDYKSKSQLVIFVRSRKSSSKTAQRSYRQVFFKMQHIKNGFVVCTLSTL